MTCNRCGSPMRVVARTHHKKNKWVCPRCRRVRLSAARYQRPKQGDGRVEKA